MSMTRKVIILACVLALVGLGAWAGGTAEKKALPPGPAFDSATTASDEGTVKPVAQKSPKPIKIAVLGLENNPFWIPVKEGTMKAAEELAPLNCKVDWINAGAQHTTDVFGPPLRPQWRRAMTPSPLLPGDSGLVPYINKAVDAGIPVATFNSETATAEQAAVLCRRRSVPAGSHRRASNMAEVLGGKGKVAIITGLFCRGGA